MSKPGVLFSGVNVSAFLVFDWWAEADEKTQQKVRSVYSELLRDVLGTSTCEEFGLEKIQ